MISEWIRFFHISLSRFSQNLPLTLRLKMSLHSQLAYFRGNDFPNGACFQQISLQRGPHLISRQLASQGNKNESEVSVDFFQQLSSLCHLIKFAILKFLNVTSIQKYLKHSF